MEKNIKSDGWPNFLNRDVLEVIDQDFKFKSMTPVQKVVIPIFVNQHKDVVVEAITGSGKTLSFVVPIIEILIKKGTTLKKHDIAALIISPTRELAQQIHYVIEKFLEKIKKFTSILFVGGNNVGEDLNKFQSNGGHIVVATAGRLEDILSRQNSSVTIKAGFKALEFLILDEADRLLDMGFKESLEIIFKYLPKQRRTGLFSATQTDEIDKLIRAGLRNPCCIQIKQKSNVNAQRTPLELNNFYMVVEPDKKFFALYEFLKSKKSKKTIVFMSSCACVQYFTRLLNHLFKDMKILALHRKLNEKRGKIFDQFKNLDSGVLVCTDIMARGIDIEDVDWVIQYDSPKLASQFVHRCGRTARSGREGNALIMLLPNEDCYVKFILINQQVPLQKYEFEQGMINKENCDSFLNNIQQLSCKEREVYEKGKQAFVSFIRAYSKHECSHIFQIKELDLVNLAKGFGLLHMPKMPEIHKDHKAIRFVQIDTSTIPYKEKQKEKTRLELISNHNEDTKKPNKVKNFKNKSWSNKSEKKLKRKIKVEKSKILEKKRKNDMIDEEDLNELHKDFQLLKKIKRKKLSEEEFDKNIELSD